MQLRSNAFVDGSAVPRRFTCDGEDLSPSLDWTAAPATARSFVLLCDDPDAPAGKWHHWAAYDIARDQTGLAEGAGRDGGTRHDSSRPSTTSAGRATAVLARPAVMDSIIITFACWPFPSII